MVLTHPDFRRWGLARGLVTQRAWNGRRNLEVETVKLDATDEGRALCMRSLGFRAEQAVSWERGLAGAGGLAVTKLFGSPSFELLRRSVARGVRFSKDCAL